MTRFISSSSQSSIPFISPTPYVLDTLLYPESSIPPCHANFDQTGLTDFLQIAAVSLSPATNRDPA
jgi:hypothetical protein